MTKREIKTEIDELVKLKYRIEYMQAIHGGDRSVELKKINDEIETLKNKLFLK